MSFLDPTTVGLHCQTCMCNLIDTYAQNAINVLENIQVRQLIEKYDIAKEILDIPGYPQHICCNCYNILANFDEFCLRARENAQQLQNLLNTNELYIKYNDDVEFPTAVNEVEQVDIDMKTEQPSASAPNVDSENESVDFDSSDDEFLSKISKKTPASETKEILETCAKKETKKTTTKKLNGFKLSFKCSQCGQTFDNIKDLNTHKSNNECPETIDPYAIPEPKPRKVIKLVDNTPPVRVEERKYNFKCTEANCNKIFHSVNGLQKHKQSHGAKLIETFICEQCGVTYNSTSSLKWHMKEKHPTDEQREERERNKQVHKCEHCGKEYLNIYKLKYHIKERHTDEKPFKCHICGVRKAMKHILQQHMKCHDELAKIPCEYCGRPFTRKFELQEHVRAVHLKLRPFECKYCNDSFACRKTLRHHEYIHTGEKPYVCDICGIAYRQRSCLRNHKKTHEQLASAPVDQSMPQVALLEDTDYIIEQIISST